MSSVKTNNVHGLDKVDTKRSKTRLVKNNSIIVAQPPKPKNSNRGSRKRKSDELSQASVKSSASTVGSLSTKSSRGGARRILPPRKSSLEFVPANNKKKPARQVIANEIVCTSCSPEEIDVVRNLVDSLGTYKIGNAVTARTSHLVTGKEERRTLNVLKALSRGCWVLTKDWLYKCLESQRWMPEGPFEALKFSPAVKSLRLQREAFAPKGVPFNSTLLADSAPIFVSRKTTAPCRELRELVNLCGGSIAKVASVAEVVIGVFEQTAEHCVTEKWLLDSIQYQVLKDYDSYRIT